MAVSLAFFTQASGVASLNLYSNEIFALVDEPIDMNRATNGVGLAQLAGALLSPLVASFVPKRVLIIGGQFFVATLITLVGYFT